MSASFAPSSSTTTRTIFGTWSNASASTSNFRDTVDLEAQTITGSRVPLPPTWHDIPSHPAALVHPSIESPRGETYDPIDAFFAVSRTRGTQDSRHDEAFSPTYSDSDDDAAPPPYTDGSDLPSYTAVAEPPTLAMYLFKFGFIFPLFWLAGIFVLLSPLCPPSGWEPSKTEAERQELLELLRRTEIKWAKRCLIAFSLFAFAASVITVTAVLALRS